MMTSESINFQNFKNIKTSHTHFYIDSSNKEITYLHDDLQLKGSLKANQTILKQIDARTLEGNPFGISQDLEPKYSQLMIINDVAYELKIATNDQTSMTHYLLMPANFALVENQNEYNLEKDSLTKRETEILILFSQGLSMTKIAKLLSISPHTVDSHRIKLCSKLNVRRTTQLAVWAYKLGLSNEFERQITTI